MQLGTRYPVLSCPRARFWVVHRQGGNFTPGSRFLDEAPFSIVMYYHFCQCHLTTGLVRCSQGHQLHTVLLKTYAIRNKVTSSKSKVLILVHWEDGSLYSGSRFLAEVPFTIPLYWLSPTKVLSNKHYDYDLKLFFVTKAQCYKTFYVCNLQMIIMNWTVRSWRVFQPILTFVGKARSLP